MKTKVNIALRNGDTVLKYGYVTTQFSTDEAKLFVYNTLNKIIEGQNKLKALGAKKNFFGLSEFKENYIDIDIVQEGNISTFTSGLTFKFSQISKASNTKEAFDIIFDVHTQHNGIEGAYAYIE